MITFLMILYCLECVIYEIKGEPVFDHNGIVIRQRIYFVLIQILAFSTLCLKLGQLDYAFLGVMDLIVLLSTVVLMEMIYPSVNKVLANNMIMLIGIGFIIISRLDFNKTIRQFVIVTVSLCLALVLTKLFSYYKKIRDLYIVFAVIGLAILLMVLILGHTVNGSKISFSIAGLKFQPSEFAKIIFVIFIAGAFAVADKFYRVLLICVVAAMYVLALVFSRDLGNALIFFITFLFVLFIATRNYAFLILGFMGGAGASVIAYRMFSHVRVRVQAFLDPFSKIDNQGYQITQSLFAISCGGFFGMGLSKGVPEDIPFVESDFIFSAVSEEMGAIAAVCLLMICFSSFMILMRNAMINRSRFCRLLLVGSAVLYIFQVFLTVGGGIKFIPLTGVTLPFVSYGGSSVMTSIFLFMICQGVIVVNNDKLYEEWLEENDDSEEEYSDYDEEEDTNS
ncbi:MAG: FtsW/RodA/SpoVE family cell cycle protein [Lachnospiraceae bacterium]|nr:FtsW/RodA/SpoVE family cell cycle protein [Lachnospiraceae bacterium]